MAIIVACLAPLGALAQDAARGRVLFEMCAACHKLEPNSTEYGPSLIGIIGRKAAVLRDFSYSRALLRTNIVWDDGRLDIYLADPQAFISGTRMPFSGIANKTERADLIAYLKTLR